MLVCISDQGREFNNSVVDKLFNLSGCHHHITSSYHLQGNGIVFVHFLQFFVTLYLICHNPLEFAAENLSFPI